VAESWKRLHDEELHNFYASPIIFRMIKSRRMRWEGHAAYIREMRLCVCVSIPSLHSG